MPPEHRTITSGPSAHYPLYYFIPSFSKDGRYMVVHEVTGNDVQLVRLEMATGELTPLTQGTSTHSGWARWCNEEMTGI